jgi:zeta-carotene desaturase
LKSRLDVVVVGAGVAGLNAAAVLAMDGARVRLVERRPIVGGRAYSYSHPALEEVVDSQHVLLGCCTNLLAFIAEAGLSDKVRWYDKQTFLEPASIAGGEPRASEIERAGLPVPMQYSGSFLGASMLSAADKLSVARGLMCFLRGSRESDDESVRQWYVRTGQTDGAIRHFWEPILLATLNDSSENCSMRYAGKVFYEIFLKTADGGRLGIPTVPLSEFYGAGVELIQRHGGSVTDRIGVERLVQKDGGWLLECGGQEIEAENVILAAPFEQAQRLLAGAALMDPPDRTLRDEIVCKTQRMVHSPFISILLWYDRHITDLDHAWLLDTTIQWFFHKSKIRGYAPERGSYVELVIAGSRHELPMARAEILKPALRELERFFPKVRAATLLKSGILKEARATFSVTPGLDAFRQGQSTGIAGLYLAGDWTRTDWPSTMESAARSGRLAAGAVAGDAVRYLVPELRAEGVMGWIERPTAGSGRAR